MGSVVPVQLHSIHRTLYRAAQAHASCATGTGIEGFLGAMLWSQAAPGRRDPRQRCPHGTANETVAP